MYRNKYLKYKNKYLDLKYKNKYVYFKNQFGGSVEKTSDDGTKYKIEGKVISGEWIAIPVTNVKKLIDGTDVYMIEQDKFTKMVTNTQPSVAKYYIGKINEFDSNNWETYSMAYNHFILIFNDKLEPLICGDWIDIPVATVIDLHTGGEVVYMIENNGYTKMVTSSGVAKYYTGKINQFDAMSWSTYTNAGNFFFLKINGVKVEAIADSDVISSRGGGGSDVISSRGGGSDVISSRESREGGETNKPHLRKPPTENTISSIMPSTQSEFYMPLISHAYLICIGQSNSQIINIHKKRLVEFRLMNFAIYDACVNAIVDYLNQEHNLEQLISFYNQSGESLPIENIYSAGHISGHNQELILRDSYIREGDKHLFINFKNLSDIRISVDDVMNNIISYHYYGPELRSFWYEE